jgi:hypothetical protein
MRISHPEGRTPIIRQFVLVLVAVTWFALLLPVGARAAGQLVTIVDPTTSDKARVESSKALRVAEFNDPARRPFTKLVHVPISANQFDSQPITVTTVPSGQRLVIETISVGVLLPTGQRATSVVVQVNGTGFLIPLSFMAAVPGAPTGADVFGALQRVQLYANPQSDVIVIWGRNSTTGNAPATFSISGHFVKL